MIVSEALLKLAIPNQPTEWDTQQVLQRAARRVREWRRLHGEMSQIQFARIAHISPGTLQGFERATRKTHDSNLLKIAAAIGITLEELIREDDPPVPPDRHIVDLKPEDFRIAHAYHHSGADVKHAIKRFFASTTSDERRERVAVWIARLLDLTDEELAHQERLTTGFEHRPPAAATTPPPRPTTKAK